MKRTITTLLILFVLLSLVACGSSAPDASTSGTNQEPTQNGPFITIKESPDKYTWYIRNYVGKNCASFGRTLGNSSRCDEYGNGEIKFVFVAEDNSFVDPADKEALKNYVVIAQSVAPNTELKYTYLKDSQGNEFESLVGSQNIEVIELLVKRISDSSGVAN